MPLYQKEKLIQATKWAREYVDSLPDAAFLVIEGDYAAGKTTDKRARHLPIFDEGGNLVLGHYEKATTRSSRIVSFSGPESDEELRAKARAALEKLSVVAEDQRKKQRNTSGGGKQNPPPEHKSGHPHRAGSAKAAFKNKPDSAGGKGKMDEKEAQALQAERDALAAKVKELGDKVAEFEQADSAKTLAARDTRIQELEAKVQELEAGLEQATKAKDDAEAKSATLSATNEELAGKNTELSSKIEAAEKVEADAKIADRKAEIEAMENISEEYKAQCLARADAATDEDWAFVVSSAEQVNGGKGKAKGKSPLVTSSEEGGNVPAGAVPGGLAGDNKLQTFHKALKAKRAAK